MNKLILIKYGELTTKKANRKFFINTLKNNIKNKFKDLNILINSDISRMYIEYDSSDEEIVKKRLNELFGIHTYQIASKVESSIDKISEEVINLMKDKKGTFKVETKRCDKNFKIESIDFSRMMGGIILKSNNNLKVDVHNPDTLVNIEILERYTYVYTDKFFGLGGYPVGVQKKGMVMLSGGIDSPVAAFLSLKRGITIDCVYFEAIPHTSLEAREKVINLCKKLSKYQESIKLHIISFTDIQESIYKYCNKDYTITIMRRMMYRIMEKLSHKNKGLVIINGESIGQVASQTLTSISVINSVTNMPVIRPVACFDKLEIIDIAKKIDTYDISIIPFEDCCTVFVPKHPVINPNINECIKNEELFDYEKLITDAVDKVNTIIINEDYNNHKDLL